MAAVDAVYPAARNPMAFPWLARGGLAAHIVRRIYLFWPNDPTVWIDVSATVERKIGALRAHASQIHEPERLESRIREWVAETGAKVGLAAAEGFRLVIIEDDDNEGPNAEAANAEAAETTEAAAAPAETGVPARD
jgi:LmbE family N-acetylglucosaminyl deacetylase